MANNRSTKIWNTDDGVLSFSAGLNSTIPTADEIYSAVFEYCYSSNISMDDVLFLKKKITFSRYPVDLKIRLTNNDYAGSKIILSIIAIIEPGTFVKVSWGIGPDHIVFENKWYPFLPIAIEEVSRVIAKVDATNGGEINLGQYLLLLKQPGDLVINEVQSVAYSGGTEGLYQKPTFLNADLYPYQKSGYQWLRFLWREKIGGILADEMGLGKTLQIIALLCSSSDQGYFPSLIIAPTSLLENWRREFEKFAPSITSHIHQGPKRTGFPNDLKKFNITITSYDTVIRDVSLFSQIDWMIIVCDEAQSIKNPSTRRANAIKRIPRQIGIAVTGTPIENTLIDLWSIMDFALPSFLGSQLEFEKLYEQTVTGAARLEKIISPIILRRTVAEVAKDLPAKIIIPQVLEMSPFEGQLYEQIRQETLSEFATNASLVVLIRLRIFCAHPFLVNDQPGEDPALHSTKYARLVEIAEEIFANGSKLIVFTSYNKMNDIIVSDLAKRFGVYSASIDGRTPSSNRQGIVDDFSSKKGAAFLVLNPIAAGTGLNITAANHVIHYNLEWNPAKEDQASARAYRRGQDRPVTIHRLFYANTVEEAIDERLNRKRELAGSAIIGIEGKEDDYIDIKNAIHKSPQIR